MDASNKTIEVRYSETRRIHPLFKPNRDLSECIKHEKKLLLPLKKLSTIIKTDGLNPKELRDLIIKFITKKIQLLLFFNPLVLSMVCQKILISYLMLDTYQIHSMKKNLLTKQGLISLLKIFFSNDPEASSSVLKISNFIKWNIKNFMNSRNFLVFSIGCTGGKHRSVYLVEKINNILANKLIIKKHRDLM